MKKIFLFLLTLTGLMMMSVSLMAQGNDPPPGGEYEQYFATFAALVALIPLVTEFFKNLIKPPPGFWTQLVSWATGILITVFAWVFNLGILDPLTFWEAALIGFTASLAANGVFDTGIITWILKLLGLLPEKPS